MQQAQVKQARRMHPGLRAFSLFGILIAGFGVYLLVQTLWLLTQGAHAEGRVVESVASDPTDYQLQQERERGVTDVDRPDSYIVEFTASDERSYRIEATGVRGAEFEMGEVVGVIYPRDDPTQGKVSAVTQLWLPPLLLIFMGGVFWLVAVVISMMV